MTLLRALEEVRTLYLAQDPEFMDTLHQVEMITREMIGEVADPLSLASP